MTTKTRMNRELRIRLTALARDKLFSFEMAPEIKVLHAKASKMVMRRVKAEYPVKEMEILKKWGCTRDHNNYELIIIENGTPRYANWSFEGVEPADLPLQPHVHYGTKKVRIEDAEDLKILNAYLSGKAAHDRVQQDKYVVFQTLIDNAKYIEQIEEVWPDAKSLRPQVPNLPTIQLAPIMDQVRAIVAKKYA